MKKTAQQISITYYVLRIKYFVSKLSIINHQSINHNPRFSAFGAGFTLIEMLVAVTILATLIGGVILSLNPIGQINKSQDAQRMADLQSIKTALDLFYDDNKCYPTQVPFGNEWRVNNTVYMKKVPQDARCDNGSGTCYRYRTDDAVCPQWNVVFAQLSKASALTNTCALSSLSNCTPSQGYSDATWACTLSGAVDCGDLLATSLLGGVETVGPTPTDLPASPTPTQPPPSGSQPYNTLDSGAIPDAYEVTIMPLCQNPGLGQAIRVKAEDTAVNISRVDVVLYSDGDARVFNDIGFANGTAQNGTWEAAWEVTDTYNRVEGKIYGYDITTTDSAGRVDIDTIRDVNACR